MTTQMPLSLGGGSDTSPRIEGYERAPNEDVTVYYSRVSTHYFASLQLPIVAGRAFDGRDAPGAALAVVINETMAKRYWAGRDPVGGRLDYGGGWATVIGVAHDGKYGAIAEPPRNVMYLPMAQSYRPTPTLIVATSVEPAGALPAIRQASVEPAGALPAIRQAVRELNPNLPLFEVRTLEEHLGASVFLPRLASMLLGAFGGLALLLAVIGLYGVVAYGVSMRTREIGVRMALGAGRRSIRGDVLGQGLRLVLAGLGVGLAAAVILAPLMASQLVGVRPTDVIVLASTSGLLLVVAGAATWLPAWRASRIDPIRALRQD
jgi:predicted permease